MSNDRPWQVFVLFRALDPHDGDRLLQQAALNSRLTYYATADEARTEAEYRVRKLMEIDSTVECVAFYVEPFTEINWSKNPVPRPIRSRDLREADG